MREAGARKDLDSRRSVTFLFPPGSARVLLPVSDVRLFRVTGVCRVADGAVFLFLLLGLLADPATFGNLRKVG